LSAAVDVGLVADLMIKLEGNLKIKSGGQECPPYTGSCYPFSSLGDSIHV
jgi:hypothetical protein